MIYNKLRICACFCLNLLILGLFFRLASLLWLLVYLLIFYFVQFSYQMHFELVFQQITYFGLIFQISLLVCAI